MWREEVDGHWEVRMTIRAQIKAGAAFGFGFDPRADLESFDLAAWGSYYGGVVVAFGANTAPQLGGDISATGHMDGILLEANLTLDGVPIIANGEFVESTGLRSTG